MERNTGQPLYYCEGNFYTISPSKTDGRNVLIELVAYSRYPGNEYRKFELRDYLREKVEFIEIGQYDRCPAADYLIEGPIAINEENKVQWAQYVYDEELIRFGKNEEFNINDNVDKVLEELDVEKGQIKTQEKETVKTQEQELQREGINKDLSEDKENFIKNTYTVFDLNNDKVLEEENTGHEAQEIEQRNYVQRLKDFAEIDKIIQQQQMNPVEITQDQFEELKDHIIEKLQASHIGMTEEQAEARFKEYDEYYGKDKINERVEKMDEEKYQQVVEMALDAIDEWKEEVKDGNEQTQDEYVFGRLQEQGIDPHDAFYAVEAYKTREEEINPEDN